mgnify:CR=1 FL=1
MEFREGTEVFTADGKKVGEMERVVIDPRTKQVTHVVIEKGFLFTESRVLPIEVIDHADADRVVLSARVDEDLDAWPVFEETYTIPLDEPGAAETLGASGETVHTRPARPYYWYPPVGLAYTGGALGVPYYPGTTVEVERNVPEGSAALKEGAAIYTSDDEHVGDVERVFTDSETDTVTHLLISRGLLFKSYKLVPASWIADATDDEVFLSVEKRVLERLPDYEGDDR